MIAAETAGLPFCSATATVGHRYMHLPKKGAFFQFFSKNANMQIARDPFYIRASRD